MKLSNFGKRFCAESGTYSLMDDLGKALTTNPDMLFLGGGNPAQIPEIKSQLLEAYDSLLSSPNGMGELCTNYQSPQGDPEFLDAVAAYLNRQCGWKISSDNVAVTNGSQAAFFTLFNMFAGEFDGEPNRHITLPLSPEYIGYSGAGLSDNFFKSCKPKIEVIDEHAFKYHIDFNALAARLLDEKSGHESSVTGALCISRPSNPSSNVISDAELDKLSALAKSENIPLIIDGAYGLPFPGVIFNDATVNFDDNTILVLSLSKLGLPGARTGIVVAKPEVIDAFAKANTAINLAAGSMGPAVTKQWFQNDKIADISSNIIQPFYRSACDTALSIVKETCADLPIKVHVPEGAFFLWLWCEDLPIPSEELYLRLKEKGVLVLSGHHFFIAIDDDWPHKHQCIRLSYCQPKEVIEKACKIIAEELRVAYSA